MYSIFALLARCPHSLVANLCRASAFQANSPSLNLSDVFRFFGAYICT